VFSKRAADVIANEITQPLTCVPDIDLSAYPDKKTREREFKALIMNEIKRKDKAFYDKWCNNED